MNSFINSLLEKRNISEHDGRPLWKYNLSDEEYAELKKHLSTITEQELDTRDITLYFAEWWKNEYNGGFPTKQLIYNSLGQCEINQIDFYKYAKRGAVLLGLKWIQRYNRLYFRTLLMQGGLPINHLLNNSGFYTNFLKKVLEINPSTIEEFIYDNDIIKYLPYSSRNEAVYDSCLQIVRAIWNGDDEYLKIFENRSTSTASFKKISDELKKHKREVEKIAKKRTKFRANWVLIKNEEQGEIYLEFNFPVIIEKKDFSDLTQIQELQLQPEYNFIIDDILVCKFKKNIKGDYKIFWFNNSKVIWNGEETKPEIYLSTIEGEKFNFPILMIDNPKITEPTLWTSPEENKWVLQQGKYCRTEKGIILFDNQWNENSQDGLDKINIFEKTLNWIAFENEIEILNDNEKLVFKTNTTSFDWFINESKPNWIAKSNMPVVIKKPQIIAYRKNGEKIAGLKLSWRLKGENIWQKWNTTILPEGCIQIKLEALNCEETDCFYNIGNLNLDFSSNNQNSEEAQITVEQNKSLSFEVKYNNLYEQEKINNTIKLKLKNLQKGIKTIPAIISKPNQIRSLHIEIVSPFDGINILAPDGEILRNNDILLFGNLLGYRIVSQFYKNDYFIKLYNTRKKHINIIKALKSHIIPLREYEELAIKLFRLTDAMDKNSAVSIELYNSKGKLLNNFLIKNHNKTLVYNNKEGKTTIEIDNSDNNIDLFAIPLDCAPFNISLIPIKYENNTFTILESIFIDKYILFSGINNNLNTNVLPCFVSTNQNNIPTDLTERKNRIKNHTERLHSENATEHSWERILKYYKICVNNEISFSTFDILKATTQSPELTAKLFCFLSIHNEDENFIEKTCKDIENDLGVSFHWISNNYWDNAIKWIKTNYKNPEIEQLLRKMIFSLINNSEPIDWFAKIAKHSLKGIVQNNSFHLNTAIASMRQSLGEKVINELPEICPKIPEEYKPILPVTYNTRLVKILLKAPLAVALSITGKDESIWKDDEQTEIIRRNIQYCQWIAPDWYGKAILYSLNKLQD